MKLKQKLATLGLTGILALATQTKSEGSLVASWNFNEGQGNTIYDSSGNGNNGTINGATYTNGVEGFGLTFDGINDLVSVPYSPSIGQLPAITIEAQIKRNSLTDGMVISKNGPYFLSVRDNKVEGGIYAGDGWLHVRGVTNIGLDNWNHIGMSYDGSHLKVYLNYLEEASALKTGEILVTSQSLHLGWGEPGHDQYFNGSIDEVKIHDVAIPEPKTFGTLALGLVAITRRRN